MQLSDRYRVVRELRAGEGRSVLLAQDRIDGTACVLKLAEAGTERADLLREEALRLGSLSHPHLVRLRAVLRAVPAADGQVVTGLCAAWADGRSWSVGLADAPDSARFEAAGQLVSAVDHLHRRGLLHLDLKPDNVLWSGSWLTLLDLGSAQPTSALPGTAGGTLGYASPEVVRGEAATVASDVFSLAVMVFEALAGVPAFDATAAVAAPRALPMASLRPDLPPRLTALIDASLAAHPADRPRSVEAWFEVLAALGVAAPRRGAPPMVGRDAVRDVLSERLVGGHGRAFRVDGQPGSGRRRLAWAALVSAMDAGVEVVDLTAPDRRAAALPWLARSVEAAAETGAPRGAPMVAWRGDPTTWSAADGATWEALEPAWRAAGWQVLEVSAAASDDRIPVSVPPLSTHQVDRLARFYRVEPERAVEACRQTGGWPGPLLQALDGGGALDSLSPPGAAALATLRAAPDGAPLDAFAALTEPSGEVLAELVARYAAWAGPDGRVWVHSAVGAAAGVALDPARLTAAAAATDDRCWAARARLAAGVVTDDQLRSGLAAASRISDRIELAGALARRGDRSARALWAELLATRARNEEVVAALRDAPARSPAEDLLLCRALRQSGEREAGLALAHSLLARAPRADLWVEVARGELERVELAASAAALDAAEALPDPPHDDILCLRLRFALQQGQRGQAEAGPAAMARFEAAAARRPVSRAALGAAARLVAHLGDGARAIELLQAAQARADADGERLASAGIRLNLANKLAREGRASEARAAFQESLQIAVSSNLPGIIMRVRAQLVSLETRLGRLGAAESELRALHALVEASGDREGETWLRYRGAWLALAQGRPEAALEHLDLVQAEAATTITQVELDLLRAEALLAMGRPEEALELAQSLIDYPHEEDLPRLEVVLGGAHVALGRRHLDGAVSLLPTQPGELHRTRAGGVLLAAGGEGLDAAGLSVRRARLERAAQLLRGPRAARAATLRDRILDGPGAALDGIVALTEAIHDPNDFPEAVARLVRESLGAHRVLIMVRMPGLGQVTWTELSGAEKSGIGSEVMRRIKRPSDVWVAANAFADPHLRRTSQTVRTFELKSLLAVAIARGDHAIGALYVDDLHRPNRFGPAEVALLQRLGRAVGALLPVVGASRQPLLPRSEPRDLLGVRTAHPGDIERIERALDAIRGIRAAGRPVNILITGPTGAGKTVLADRLAREALGKRGVVALGLQQLPNEMLITNLAGADKGEFTGARDKDGLIERALRSNKALFLDELQDLGRVGQQTLLPLLELPERRFGKLTREQKAIRGDLPILLGTNADVQSGAWRSVFREDLWYRIEGLRLDLPPLGRRGVEAIYQYLAEMLSQHGAPAPEVVFSTRTLERLTAGSWPGNLRQLSAFAALAASRWAGREVPLGEAEVEATVPDALGARTPTPATPGRWSGRDAALLERIWPALERHAFVQSRAADEVGMRPAQLSKILGRNGLRGEVKQRRRAHRGRDPHATPR